MTFRQQSVKSVIKRRFATAAMAYDQHAFLQRDVADTLIHKLKENIIHPPQSILEIGCGTGYLTNQLGHLFTQSYIVGLDLAPTMLNVCQKAYSQGNYLAADGEQLPFIEPFDLIASSLCLQWFQQPEASLKNLIKLGKNLALTTFGPQSFREWHEICQQYNIPIRTQKFLSIEALSQIFGNSYSIESLLIQKPFTGWQAFWQQIRAIGASHGTGNPSQTPSKNLKTVLGLKDICVTHEIIFITTKG